MVLLERARLVAERALFGPRIGYERTSGLAPAGTVVDTNRQVASNRWVLTCHASTLDYTDTAFTNSVASAV